MYIKNAMVASLLFGLSTMTFTGCENSDNNTTANGANSAAVDCLSGDSPIITLEGETNINIPLGTYTVLEDGDRYSACDPQDGDLSAEVRREHNINFDRAGTYQISYNVTDSDGHSAETQYRTVTISDGGGYDIYSGNRGNVVGSLPTITFTDNNFNSLFLRVGEVYDRFAYRADDLEDGDLTSRVRVGGDEVDTHRAGTYYVTYSVTDSDNNTVTRDRTIYVGDGDDLGELVGSSGDINTFKAWYRDTCGQNFIESAYNEATAEYNSKIDCSNRGLDAIDLTPLSVFRTIKSLDLSHNRLSSIDFNDLGLEENNVKVLEDLDLSYNNFDYIDFRPLHNLKNINRLWIQGNNLDYDTKEKREELYKIFNNRSLTIYF
jgi:hypothetical protein